MLCCCFCCFGQGLLRASDDRALPASPAAQPGQLGVPSSPWHSPAAPPNLFSSPKLQSMFHFSPQSQIPQQINAWRSVLPKVWNTLFRMNSQNSHLPGAGRGSQGSDISFFRIYFKICYKRSDSWGKKRASATTNCFF